ncbi:MAG: carbohydrate binding domain-containing protein [Verrucomicrobiota bacterium]
MIRNLKSIPGYLFVILIPGMPTARAADPVMVDDYESDSPPPAVWVVNLPNENASVQRSDEQPHDGKACLKLHYHFTEGGSFQYLGVPNKKKIAAPIQRLRFRLKGDNSKCSYGVQVSDASGETHQYSQNTGQGGTVDFTGWKEVVIDIGANHETWGGDKNGKMDYPINAITFTVGQPRNGEKSLAMESDLSFDSLAVDSEHGADEILVPRISVNSPEYGSDIKGTTRVALEARGFKSVTVKCWKQGSDSTVATVALDEKGKGSFDFPADDYPHGPITVRISGANAVAKDNCYLQLYNKGGVAGNSSLTKTPPPAAKGMSLVFADDFNGPLSISSTDFKASYYDHKPPNGSQDFSTLRFTGFHEPNNPFHQVDTWLRIRASEKSNSSGLISSMKNNATGITAKAPCYFECRFLGPNAIGTWPAFWIMTDYMTDHVKGIKVPCDELDIIEAYGGEGPGAPNAFDAYMIAPHCWDQGEAGKALEKVAYEAMKNPIRMNKFGVRSTWYEAFHTYGCKITETETIYYCDDIEVARHATFPLSKERPFFFLINLATGGGWPVDLSRYNGVADMYVDFVRVYQQP